MSSQVLIVLDGGQAYGARVVTINSIAYNAEKIVIQRPVQEADDKLTTGVPGRKRATIDVAKLTMTLQLAASTTARPSFGQVYTDTFDSANYGAESFILYPPPYDESNAAGEIRKIEVTGWKAINGNSPTIVTG